MAERAPDTFPPSDELLLSVALRGDNRAWTTVTDRLDPYLNKIIQRRAGDLPEDIQKEIKQEVWAAVARPGSRERIDPTEAAKDYLRRFLRPAIDRVRSAYRVPGTRSRRRNEMLNWEAPQALQLESIGEPEDELSNVRLQRIETRFEIEVLLTPATRLVAMAAMLMMNSGYNISEAARATGLQRLALHRGLRTLGRRRVA
ncbi:MAG TPA: hypothetical protein VGU64_09225 [Terriglobales bacterium]|nr:hypothetical protein [Terriglobales bacterium]